MLSAGVVLADFATWWCTGSSYTLAVFLTDACVHVVASIKLRHICAKNCVYKRIFNHGRKTWGIFGEFTLFHQTDILGGS